MADNFAHPYNRLGQVVTINDLPDDDLLRVFDFYVVEYQYPGFIDSGTKREIESWQSLVHVCRRWRGLVFASPRRLNLRLCTSTTVSSDVWPPLPLLIQGGVSGSSADNVLAELEHRDRIRQIQIDLDGYTTWEIETLWTAMQVPFPELASLLLCSSCSSNVPVLPDSFLRGSASRLRDLTLYSIPFPGIPKLLLSATHLVRLSLRNIPHSGYISPEAMVTCLSALTSLEFLQLGFESPQSCPDLETQRPFLPTRFILPTLTKFWFKGVNEYLEEFLARIDAPQIYVLSITLFNDIQFNTPELIQFISRTPSLGVYHDADIIFRSREASVTLLPQRPQPEPSNNTVVKIRIVCQVSDWQLSSMTQICALSLRPLLTVENLYIDEDQYPRVDWKDDIENTEWLDLIRPFIAVKNLYLSRQFAPRIAPVLQELTEGRTTEVLPALKNILLQGFQPSEPVQEGIARFISARQLINRPVVISLWNRGLAQDESEEPEEPKVVVR